MEKSATLGGKVSRQIDILEKEKKNKCWKEKSRKIGFKTLQINSMNKKKEYQELE